MRLQPDQQHGFSAALLDPEAAVPAGVTDPKGQSTPKRFAVYRNNVAVSLVEALNAAFPACRALCGEAFFAALAREFAFTHLPRSPLMIFYGEDFPAFLRGFEPAQQVPFLPDVAALECAWRRAYHAPDCVSLPGDALGKIPPEQLGKAVLNLQASLCLVTSPFPVFDLWKAGRGGADMPEEATPGQAVLIVRPDMEVLAEPISPGFCAALESLRAGENLETSLGRSLEIEPSFDVPGFFAAGVRLGLFTRIQI